MATATTKSPGAGGAVATILEEIRDTASTVGTAGVPSANANTIQGISGGTPVAVSAGGTEIEVVLSLDTAAYASGDLLADTQEIALAVAANGGRALLQSIQLLDESNQSAAFTLHFLTANTSFGTENSAPTITATNMRDSIGIVDVGTGDWRTIGATCRVASLKNIGLGLKAGAGTRSIYFAVVNGTGTPTYTAAALRLKFTLLWEA